MSEELIELITSLHALYNFLENSSNLEQNFDNEDIVALDRIRTTLITMLGEESYKHFLKDWPQKKFE
jgi:hypothetical protein